MSDKDRDWMNWCEESDHCSLLQLLSIAAVLMTLVGVIVGVAWLALR